MDYQSNVIQPDWDKQRDGQERWKGGRTRRLEMSEYSAIRGYCIRKSREIPGYSLDKSNSNECREENCRRGERVGQKEANNR